MKKLLALLVSVIMAASLAVPAFAAPGLSPEEAASLGVIGGADGPTAILVGGSLGGGGCGTLPDPDEYLAAHPGLEEELRANAYDYFAQELKPGMTADITAEEYMEYLGLTEEEFLELMVEAQLWELREAESERWAIDKVKEALGGVPGQVGVRVNNQYIQFPDAVPEVKGGVTMVPVRALGEALGGEVEADGGKIMCRTDEVSITFTLGSAEALVEYPGGGLPGDGQICPLGCAPYLKDGRTYVPVRFLADALGCEVGWDGEYETVILLDREAMAAEIDKDFTILNRAMASRGAALEEGRNYRAGLKGSVTVTAFDTIHGDQTSREELTGEAVFNSEAASGRFSLSLSDTMVKRLAGEYELEPEVEERIGLVLSSLEDMSVILTKEGRMWLHAPALDELAGEKNVWMGWSQDMDWTALAGPGRATMGQALADLIPTDSVVMQSGADSMVMGLAELCRDERFTTSSGVSTLTIGLEEWAQVYELYAGVGMSGVEDEFEEFALTLKVDSKGGSTVDCVVETAARYGMPAVRMAISSAQSGETASLTMEYHIANQGKAELTFTASLRAVSDGPMTQPPEGAVVVDAPELLNP